MKQYNGEYVIIRSEKAGVFAGNIVERDAQEVKIANVKRLWYWDGANSLSQLAICGTSKPTECKFTQEVKEMEILGVIEIIPCTEKAEKSIKGVKEWKL